MKKDIKRLIEGFQMMNDLLENGFKVSIQGDFIIIDFKEPDEPFVFGIRTMKKSIRFATMYVHPNKLILQVNVLNSSIIEKKTIDDVYAYVKSLDSSLVYFDAPVETNNGRMNHQFTIHNGEVGKQVLSLVLSGLSDLKDEGEII